MKSSSKKTAKLRSRSNGKLKPSGGKSAQAASGKRASRQAAKKGAKKRRTTKSTVPPQFRELKQLAAKKDPRFWDLRKQFRDYLRGLPEESVEPFLAGLGEPYLGYLVMEMIQERANPYAAKVFWSN
jgi:hypothetical protein